MIGMKNRFGIFLAFAWVAGIVGAGEYVWTGVQDAYWTNAANWTVEGVAAANPPGWVLARMEGGLLTTNGTPADVAVFGACTTGQTTINLDGQWKIDSVVFTNDAPAYTLGTGTAKAQFLMLGLNAKVTVAEAVTADQTIQVLCSTLDASVGDNTSLYKVSLYNNSPTAKLVYNRVDRYEGGGCPYYYLYGVGTIHQNGDWAFDRSSGFYLHLTGRFILGNKLVSSGNRVYTYNSMEAPALGGIPRIIEVPEGCSMSTTGGGWQDSIITAYENTHVVGNGQLIARNQFNSSKYLPELGGNFSVAAGKLLEVDTAIVPSEGGVTSTFPGSVGLFGSGTLLLHGSNTCTGAVRIHETGTLAVTRVGTAGCAADESCLGTGSEIRFYSNGTLKYVGDTATATDRAFTTTNLTSALTITCANGGSGTLTLTSHQKMLLANAYGATLKLNAETAPIVFGGTFEAGQDWRLQVAGTAGVSFPSEPGVPVALAAGATLGLSSTTVLPSNLTLAGNASIVAAAGQNLTLDRLPLIPAGKTLAFTIPEGASVTLAGRPNLRLDNITVNGAVAQTDATGKLVVAGTFSQMTWTSVTSGGAWSATANWKDAQKPGALDDVFIANDNAASGSYTITLDEDAQVNGITMQEQAGGTITLGGTKTLTIGGGGYTVLTNTTRTVDAGVVAGGPFNLAAPVHLAASQRWLLGSIRGWGYLSGCNTFTGDLSSTPDAEWSILGYGRYVFTSGSSKNYLGTTKVGVQVEFDGTNQFHRLGTNEIHLYRGTVTDGAAFAAGTTNTAPGLLYRFKDDEKEATVVNPFRVTGNSYVRGSRTSWSYDENIIAYKWANNWPAFTNPNRGTRLILTGGISCSSLPAGVLQFSQSWNNTQPVTAYRCFDPDFGRIVVAGDGHAFATGTVRTFTMLEIAHPDAFGPNNIRDVCVGSDGYWNQYFPYTVAGVLVRPGLTHAGRIYANSRSDSNGAQKRPATMLLGSAETPVAEGETTAVFSGAIEDNNEDSNELRFTAAAGTTAKFTGKVTVQVNRWKYRGTPDIVARGDVELANPGNTFGTNLCVRAGGLVLDANAAGKLPIVLGGYVPLAIKVRCADGIGDANGTLANVARDGVTLYGKKMTFSSARTIDGIRVQPGDYVLNIYPGTIGSYGIWKVVSDTEWQRPDELDEVEDVIANRGLRAIVKEGSTFGGTSHFLVTDPTHFRASSQYATQSGNEYLNSQYGAPVFHPDTVAQPAVALLTGAATTITNAIEVTDNHSSAPSTIGGKTAEASAFSGPIKLAKSVTLAAAEGGTVAFTGSFTGAGDLIGGGAGVSDVTAATIALDATNGFRCASGTLKVTATQLGTRPLGWIRTTDGEGESWTETTGQLAVTGDLDLRNRAFSFVGFEKDDVHTEKRTLTLATCTGTLTLPSEKSVTGSSGRWTLVADGQTLRARHALTGMMFLFR